MQWAQNQLRGIHLEHSQVYSLILDQVKEASEMFPEEDIQRINVGDIIKIDGQDNQESGIFVVADISESNLYGNERVLFLTEMNGIGEGVLTVDNGGFLFQLNK